MIRYYRILFAMTIVGVALRLIAPMASGQDGQTQSEATSRKPAAANASAPATPDPTYVIGAQDSLSISVWKEPDLSGVVQVRPDGKVSMPLLNDVQASGLTAMQLSSQLTAGLKKYVADPHVTVVVTAINSRRVYVLGEVTHAGGFTLLPDMTVLQVISDAGGLTQFAHGKKIYVLRQEDGKQVKYPFDYVRVLKGQKPEQNIALKSGDTVVVP